MDTSDPDIVFDAAGVCNHCKHHDELARRLVPKPEDAPRLLEQMVSKIKAYGADKEYDCLIGLSGGVDSSYVALKVKELGLRPLAVHLDNGWNSELAVQNVENIVNKLGIDLFTIVINWEEFKDLQLAYLRSGVVDLEVTSDHAIFASMYDIARKNKIRYVINGTNVFTESIMPESWYYKYKTDLVNLEDINNKFGSGRSLKTYPTLSFVKAVYLSFMHKLEWIPILNYMGDYIKTDAKETIKRELNWRDYGGKHHESIITKFYQSYILPVKFGVDKRRAHLSDLICDGQITREEALEEIKQPLYKSDAELEADIEYIVKKFGITRADFDQIMADPPRKHSDFKTDKGQRKLFYSFVDMINKIKGK